MGILEALKRQDSNQETSQRGVRFSLEINGCVLPLEPAQTYSIGRDMTTEIPLMRDDHVSRVHALITVYEDRVTVKDLLSANGTTVNGVLLQEEENRVLKDGDKIEVGYCTLIVRQTD